MANLKSTIRRKMEVTKQNFREVLDSLPAVFQKAQFLALDTEFTGLKIEGTPTLTCFDSLQDLYLKDRLKAEAFIAIQFGVVAFFYDNDSKKYTHIGYNFYTYPSSKANSSFTCEGKTIKFLVEHGFDFNKLFRDGISYLRESDGQYLLDKLNEKFEKNSHLDDLSKTEIPPQRQSILDDIKKQIKCILQSGTQKSFTTEKYNSYIRRLIYNSVKSEFGEKVLLETKKDETMVISVGCSPEEIKQKHIDKFSTEKQEILDEIGFSKVIKLIIESNKLLVGHNLLLDLLFTINQCLAPLPASYIEFKSLVQFLFPKILDTKYMVSTIEFKNLKDTSLITLAEHFGSLNMMPDVEMCESGKGYNLSDNKLHEAGFDAFLTGVCFIVMAEHIGKLNCSSNVLNTLPDSPFLKPVLNKIWVPRLSEVTFMNFGGCDVEPDRVGVYHLTFPMEWTRENIIDVFKDYGFSHIAWINSTSAYVKVKKEFIQEVEKNLKKKNPTYTLRTYKEFQIFNHSKSLSADKKKILTANENNSSNDDTPLKFLTDTQKKRQTEDIGEAIERPSKKHFSL